MTLNKLADRLLYIYIVLPVVIFFAGWTKPVYAAIGCALILYGFFYFERTGRVGRKNIGHAQRFASWQPEKSDATRHTMLLALIVICLWVYFSGIGGMVAQTEDHEARNAVFNALVQYRWPIAKDMVIDGMPQSRALVYYIGFWLPSALVGKAAGLQVGYLFQMVWAVIGIALTYRLICIRLKRLSIVPLAVMMAFSGLDIIGAFLTNSVPGFLRSDAHLEWWCTLEYSSLTTQLFWVFNQCIYGWLIMMTIMGQKSNRQIGLLLAGGLITCPFLVVGMIPFALYRSIENARGNGAGDGSITTPGIDEAVGHRVPESKERIGHTAGKTGGKRRNAALSWLLSIVSIENLLGGLYVAAVTFLYFFGNSGAGSGERQGFKGTVFTYIVFIAIEVLPYVVLLYKSKKKDRLFLLTAAVLLICPMVRIGSSVDFCMRASIPALLMLCLTFTEELLRWKKENNISLFRMALVILLIGAITPLHEFGYMTTNTIERFRKGQDAQMEPASEEALFGAGNFSADKEKSFFFQHIGR